MAKFKVLQEIDGSHKATVEVDGKEKTTFFHYKYEAGQVVDAAEIPQGDRLMKKLVDLKYAQAV